MQRLTARKLTIALTAVGLLGLGAAGPAFSQDPAAAPDKDASTRCNAAEKAEPATKPEPGSGDGTAPGNAGSTGWTGGAGGAISGTTPQGATADSKTWQPPTARGLDLMMSPEEAQQKDC